MNIKKSILISIVNTLLFTSIFAIETGQIISTIQLFDTNKNGELNESELANAHQILAHIAYRGVNLQPTETRTAKTIKNTQPSELSVASKTILAQLEKPKKVSPTKPSPYISSGDIGNIPMITGIEDWNAKLKAAAEKNEPVMLIGSGESWCGWSKKLADHMYKTKEFQEYALTHNIYWIPKNRTATTPEISELTSKLNIRGVPHVIIVDTDGKLRNLNGFKDIGAQGYIEELEK